MADSSKRAQSVVVYDMSEDDLDEIILSVATGREPWHDLRLLITWKPRSIAQCLSALMESIDSICFD